VYVFEQWKGHDVLRPLTQRQKGAMEESTSWTEYRKIGCKLKDRESTSSEALSDESYGLQ